MSNIVNPYSAAPPIAVSETAVVSPPTTADFMFDIDDAAAWNSNSPFVRKQLRRLWMGMGVIVVPLLLLWTSGLGLEILVPLLIGTSLMAIVLAILLSPPLLRRRARKQYARIYRHRLPRQETVVLSDRGIYLSTPDGEHLHYWRGVENIQMTATYVFFYLTDIQAVVVPARAFRSEAQFHAFVDLARKFWHGATGR